MSFYGHEEQKAIEAADGAKIELNKLIKNEFTKRRKTIEQIREKFDQYYPWLPEEYKADYVNFFSWLDSMITKIHDSGYSLGIKASHLENIIQKGRDAHRGYNG